jgi:hypothetical protein
VEWVDNTDGTYTLRKVTNHVKLGVLMALSQSVEESLKEAEASLRNALAYASTPRTSYGLFSHC